MPPLPSLLSAAFSAVPIPAIIYRFFDSDGRLLYVGLTTAGPARWAGHAIHQPWWREVATVSVTHFDRFEDAHAAEQEAIRSENPAYNIMRYQHIDRPPRVNRPRGSGSVFRRSRDGRWVATISLGYRYRGRRVTRSAATREEAEELLEFLLEWQRTLD